MNDTYIQEFPGAISPALCAQIIAQFEADPGRRPSVTAVDGKREEHQVRTGTQLICDGPDWKGMIDALIPAFHASLEAYAQKVKALRMLIQAEGLHCTGPVIERVDPGQGFAWHYDQTFHSRERVIAGLLYLNAVAEDGVTEFREQGVKVLPEPGKLVLFPPFWTHLHRGVSPRRESKYVMSFFWIYAKSLN